MLSLSRSSGGRLWITLALMQGTSAHHHSRHTHTLTHSFIPFCLPDVWSLSLSLLLSTWLSLSTFLPSFSDATTNTDRLQRAQSNRTSLLHFKLAISTSLHCPRLRNHCSITVVNCVGLGAKVKRRNCTRQQCQLSNTSTESRLKCRWSAECVVDSCCCFFFLAN